MRVPRPTSSRGRTSWSICSLKEVVLYGLISNRGLVVVAAAMGLASQAGIFDQDWEAWGRRFLPKIDFASMEFVQLRVAMKVVLIGFASVILLLVLTRLLSIALAVFKLYGFRHDSARRRSSSGVRPADAYHRDDSAPPDSITLDARIAIASLVRPFLDSSRDGRRGRGPAMDRSVAVTSSGSPP